MKTAIIIPCYRVKNQILRVVEGIPSWIDLVIVVDDQCPDKSSAIIEEKYPNNPRIKVVKRETNGGVGAATITGYQKAKELGAEILVKMDGDDQMDPVNLPSLIEPIKNGHCQYAKGNRFTSPEILRQMPLIRLIGNSGLSFLVKFCSGYWNVMDPTNGYTAIDVKVLEKLPLNKINKRYFFEIDLLCSLNYHRIIVKDVPMDAKYGDEVSSMNLLKVAFQFPPRLLKRLLRRIFLQYFIYDFNMATFYLLVGIPMFLAGFTYGLSKWILSVTMQQPQPIGTVMLAVLPILVSLNMIMGAIHIDINNVPRNDRV